MTAATPAPPPAKLIESFKETRRWTRIVTLLGMIFCLVAEVAAVAVIALAMSRDAPEVAFSAMILTGVLLIGILPVTALFRYTSRMEEAIKERTADSVEAALAQHKKLWILSAVLILLFATWYVFLIVTTVFLPNYREAGRVAELRVKMARAVEEVRTLGEAIERYGHDNRHYPAARSAAELSSYLVPRYIASVNAVDAWGKPFDYLTRCNGAEWCYDYALIGRGRDGTRETAELDQLFGNVELPQERAASSLSLEARVDRDIVFADGRMVRSPPGMEKK